MSIVLKRVDPESSADLMELFTLLGERTKQQSISHKGMPSYFDHVKFVRSNPYKVWYLIEAGGKVVGSTYISKLNELGIFIFKEHFGNGYATAALKRVMLMHEGPFLANINPENTASLALFKSLGFDLLQVTYAHE